MSCLVRAYLKKQQTLCHRQTVLIHHKPMKKLACAHLQNQRNGISFNNHTETQTVSHEFFSTKLTIFLL